MKRFMVLFLLLGLLVGCKASPPPPPPHVATPTPTTRELDLNYPTRDVGPVWVRIRLTIQRAAEPETEQRVRAGVRALFARSLAKELTQLQDRDLANLPGDVRILDMIFPPALIGSWQYQTQRQYDMQAEAESEKARSETLRDLPAGYLEYLRTKQAAVMFPGQATTSMAPKAEATVIIVTATPTPSVSR